MITEETIAKDRAQVEEWLKTHKVTKLPYASQRTLDEHFRKHSGSFSRDGLQTEETEANEAQ